MSFAGGTAARAARQGTLLAVTEPFPGLDAVDWRALQVAYGAADAVPGLVRDLLDTNAGRRAAAVEELYATVWHQGTVYEATPVVVPFLTAVVTSAAKNDLTRAQVALLLGCIASATSFVLPEQPRQMLRPGWLREADDPTPPRDLAEASLAAVAAHASALAGALAAATPATRAALLAPLAAVSISGRDASLLAAWQPFEDDRDVRLVAAARVVRLTLEGSLSEEKFSELASVDEEAAGYLDSVGTWPMPVRVVELVRELAERVVAEQVG